MQEGLQTWLIPPRLYLVTWHLEGGGPAEAEGAGSTGLRETGPWPLTSLGWSSGRERGAEHVRAPCSHWQADKGPNRCFCPAFHISYAVSVTSTSSGRESWETQPHFMNLVALLQDNHSKSSIYLNSILTLETFCYAAVPKVFCCLMSPSLIGFSSHLTVYHHT